MLLQMPRVQKVEHVSNRSQKRVQEAFAKPCKSVAEAGEASISVVEFSSA